MEMGLIARRRQGGFTLVEVLVAVVISLGLMVVSATIMQRNQQQAQPIAA